LIFAHHTTVISVEEVLKDEGYEIRVVSPPTQYRTGCDLCVEFPLAEEAAITELLNTTGLRAPGCGAYNFIREWSPYSLSGKRTLANT